MNLETSNLIENNIVGNQLTMFSWDFTIVYDQFKKLIDCMISNSNYEFEKKYYHLHREDRRVETCNYTSEYILDIELLKETFVSDYENCNKLIVKYYNALMDTDIDKIIENKEYIRQYLKYCIELYNLRRFYIHDGNLIIDEKYDTRNLINFDINYNFIFQNINILKSYCDFSLCDDISYLVYEHIELEKDVVYDEDLYEYNFLSKELDKLLIDPYAYHLGLDNRYSNFYKLTIKY